MTEEIIIDGINVVGCEFAVKPINDNRIKCHCVKGLLQITKMHEQAESTKNGLCEDNPNCYYKQLKRLEQENKSLYEEKNCLHKIIDRLLENAGYSKDIASAEDFEDVYEDMQRKINELAELEQENKELKEENIKAKKEFNNLITEIISDIEYTGEIACNGDSPMEHLHQMQKALALLEEIRKECKCYGRQRGSNREFDREYGGELHINIIEQINEVLE